MNEDIFETPSSTPNFQTELAAQLAELVPEAIADGKIDVLKLQELLAQDAAETSERFGLFWPGKHRALRLAQMPTTATLRPEPEKSKEWDTTKNVFIEGDNLEALKILQKHYHGKVKVIYIDPPYNTGRDFVYKDNFEENIANYLRWSKQADVDGQRTSTNSETDGRYHSNWLDMMYPRLKLARNLLTDDGLIFISIDDSELANLLALSREVFGESNVIGTLIHQRAKGGGQAKFVVRGHDYLVVISKNLSKVTALLRPKVVQQPVVTIDGVDYLKNDDVLRRSFGKYDRSLDRRCFYEEVEELKGKDKKAEIDKLLAEGKLHLELQAKSGMHVIYELTPLVDATSKLYSIIKVLSEQGKEDLEKLGIGDLFDYPKPVEFVKQVIQAATLRDKNAIVLDFFAGSGTTAQAVMELNLEDNGERRYVLIQLPEPTESGSVAKKMGYLTISDITRKRISLAGEQIDGQRNEQLTLGSGFGDVGFRSYRLENTSFKNWSISSSTSNQDLEQQLFDLRDTADDKASEFDLLTEILLKQGYSLSEVSEQISIAGLELMSVGQGLVLAYLNEHVKPSVEALREVMAAEPSKLIVLEDAFQGDDELKTNLAQLCKSRNIELWTA